MTKKNEEKLLQVQGVVQELLMSEDDTDVQHELKLLNTHIWKLLNKLSEAK